jgi:hypothetical protein
MIQSHIYTVDNGQNYTIDFLRTKDQINFEHHKKVQFLSYDDLLKLRDNIEKIVIHLTYDKR